MYTFNSVRDCYEYSRNYNEEGHYCDFPPYITFELTSFCNLRCIMCPKTYSSDRNIHMDIDLFKKCIREIQDYGSMVRFIGYGEPLLYKHILEAIGIVKEAGILLHITTNGHLIDDRIIEELIDNQVDSIIFSFQGLTPEEYCLMRNTGLKQYKNLITNIQKLHEERSRRGGKYPSIKVTTTITNRDAMRDAPRFRDFHLNHADEVQITGFTSFSHLEGVPDARDFYSTLGITRPDYTPARKCYLTNYEMIIRSNGNIFPCCSAYLPQMSIGNVYNESLYSIWHSAKARNIRKITNAGNLSKIEQCRLCSINYRYPDIYNTHECSHGIK